MSVSYTTYYTLSTAEPSWPGTWTKKNGWSAPDHRPLAKGDVTVTFCDGEMHINGVQVIECLSPEQKKQGGYIYGKGGKGLQEYLADFPNLPDVLADLLIAEQDNSEVAQFLRRFEGRNLFFWGTLYEESDGRLNVRYLRQAGNRWGWAGNLLTHFWLQKDPALVLAHLLSV